MKPLFGLETEYGLAAPGVSGDGATLDGLFGNDAAVVELVDAVRAVVPTLPDPSPCGSFLSNGSRTYADNSHPELATPEVSSPWDVVRYTLAGERVLERALTRLGGANGGARPLLFKSNVDYLSRVSWGCHENILCRAGTPDASALLTPHLVSRVVVTGAGGFDPQCPGISFVLSPRALFMKAPVSGSSTNGRGIIHTKDEPLGLATHKRLHLICGESLCSERAMWLRTATTALVVAMIDEGLGPEEGVGLADPVAALHAIVRDPSCRTEVVLADGRRMTALELQRHYLRAAEARIGAASVPDWTAIACEYWRETLDQLDRAPESVATTLDWGIKRALFGCVLARHGFDWRLATRWTAALVEVMSTLVPILLDGTWADPEGLLNPQFLRRPGAARVEPILRAHGLDRADLERFLRVRRALFECDIRFGQLGGEGLFAALDRDGALTHHVAGVDDIDRAIEQPPAQGRARVRGEAIRRLANDRRQLVCDWTAICCGTTDTFLDLADPFEQEERWRPASEYSEGTHNPNRAAAARAVDWAPYTLRDQALEDFLGGRYDDAERALHALLAQGFDIHSTHCHLARVLLVQGREVQAREHVARAWAAREEAPPYVVARTAWLQTLLAIMGNADWRPWIGTLKGLALQREHMHEWSIQPLIDRLRRRLPFHDFEMLTALLRVVSGEADRSELDRHEWWSGA